MEKEEQVASCLPLDIQEQIFLRLPIKSIMKLKRLSKYYRSLLCDHRFQTKYYYTLRKSGGPGVVFAPGYYQYCGESYLKREGFSKFLLWNESIYYRKQQKEAEEENRQGYFTFAFTGTEDDDDVKIPAWRNFAVCRDNHEHDNPRLLGSWNGLVALYDGHQEFVLWNPCINQCNSVSFPCINQWKSESMLPALFGLCYDSTKNEYKVFIQYRSCRSPSISRCYLINFKSGRREKLVNCRVPRYSFFQALGTVVNGIPHWIPSLYDDEHDELSENVFCFDLSRKRLKSISLPSVENKRSLAGLGVLDGQLTVTLFDKNKSEIWGMKEYGVVDSWTKLLVIRRTSSLRYGCSRAFIPLGFTSNGDIILDIGDNYMHIDGKHRNYELMAYNPKENTFKTIFPPEFGEAIPKATYIPSLFSPF